MTATSQGSELLSEVEVWHRDAQRALNERDFKRTHALCLQILERTPQHADAVFLLGMIAAEHGNFGKAAEVIQRAIGMDANRAEYHAHLARCLIALNHHREATTAANGALALQPKDALTLDTIGVAMTRAGAHVEAVDAFRRAVEFDSSKAAYQYNLGAALQFIGDFPGAQAAFRRAIALEPGHYRAWSSLAQVSRRPFDTTDLRRIGLLLEDATSTEAQLHLCHALAKHHEDIGEYARAFQYLEKGKQRKRVDLQYSFATDAALFAAVREVCTPAFLSDNSSGSDSREPIFIVGMPRTGTTLVERILSSHPDVFAAGELTDFALAIKRATRTPSNLVLDVATLHAAKNLDWPLIGDTYIESTRPRTGKTSRFVDKMPLNFLYAGFIRRAIPNAKIICVRRNPLDTCLSNYRQLFSTNFPYYNYAYDLLDTGRYYLLFDALATLWCNAIPAHYREIHYESLVADTEAEAKKLLDFCGLQWHPACLSFHENAAPVATASAVQVRQPIYRTSIARWRHYENEITPLRVLLETAGVHAADEGQ